MSCYEHLRQKIMGNSQEKRVIGVHNISFPIPPISHHFLSFLLMLQKKRDMVEENNFLAVSDLSSVTWDSSLPMYFFSEIKPKFIDLPCSFLPTVMIKDTKIICGQNAGGVWYCKELPAENTRELDILINDVNSILNKYNKNGAEPKSAPASKVKGLK